MDRNQSDWQKWRQTFEDRAGRSLPKLESDLDYSALPPSLAKSLAIFQLGESGGGTIVDQARYSRLPGLNNDYSESMSLFVEEEHRHANILAMCVRFLGGTLIRKNWTARLFIFTRRLIGLRLKVLVLLAAEVVGICYYQLLASHLPPCQLKRLLLQLVEDEQSHLQFHCSFLRSQTQSGWKRQLFVVAWRSLMLAAAVAVMVDHRNAIRDMKLTFSDVWNRWCEYRQIAEDLVTESGITEQLPVLSHS